MLKSAIFKDTTGTRTRGAQQLTLVDFQGAYAGPRVRAERNLDNFNNG